MGFSRFSIALALRLILIFTSVALSVLLILKPGYHAATLLALVVTLLLTIEVYWFVSKTNQELARFLDAVRYADFGQRFRFGEQGAGFERLGATFTHILDRFREERKGQEQELRHLKALIEHVPVPLISVCRDGSLDLWNNAARRLFGTAHVTRTEDLRSFGDEFFGYITTLEAGQRVVCRFDIDGMTQQLILSASDITIDSRAERLISLQNIQSELDVMQQNAWQDLVRVLTHEIMNSITPVASLARTASVLVEDARSKVADHPDVVAELQDAQDAVTTVARRSDGLMKFVGGYRKLTRLPTPNKTRFVIGELFNDVVRIAVPGNKGVSFQIMMEPSGLDLVADRELVEQVLINLLQNAVQVLVDTPDAIVWLSARLNVRGHVVIEVADNGPGITDDVASRMFVPFYTTRREGSGVGLALSRQIMIVHGGSITFLHREGGGARFMLVF